MRKPPILGALTLLATAPALLAATPALAQAVTAPAPAVGSDGVANVNLVGKVGLDGKAAVQDAPDPVGDRSEEHTSELQSLMRISYAVFCLKKKKTTNIRRSVASRFTTW